MDFFHPGLLSLLPLAAIPLVLHLLMWPRLRTMELSTYRFLLDSYVQQRRKTRLTELSLALLRALVVAALIVAAARPLSKHWGAVFARGAGHHIIMLVDCSASMNLHTTGQSALDRAKSAALTILERMDPADRLTVIRVTTKAEEVCSELRSEFDVLRERIGSLKLSPGRASFLSAFQHVSNTSQSSEPVLIYVFTDGQPNSWNEIGQQNVQALLPRDSRVVVVQTGSSAKLANVGVAGRTPDSRQAIVGLPITVKPQVTNYSADTTASLSVGIFIDEQEVNRASLTLRPGETASRPLLYVPTQPGAHAGRFEIRTQTPDAFADDDVFRFSLTVAPRVHVLLVNGSPGDGLTSETLYLRAALSAVPDGFSDDRASSESAKLGSAFQVHEIGEKELSASGLMDANVIILANCGGLNARQFGWLRDFVNAGGGLVVFPGDRVKPEAYNAEFFSAAGPAQAPWTSVKLGLPQGNPDDATTFERVARVDWTHPALTIFNQPDTHYLQTARFYRRFGLMMPERTANTWPLVEFSNRMPGLVESRLGEGIVLVAAFPASPKWTNLPLKPEFVPLLLRLIGHARRGPEIDLPAVVPPERPVPIRIAKNWAPVTGEVVDASGGRSPLAFEAAGNYLVSAFDKNVEAGYYTVGVKGGSPDHPKSARRIFAVNLAPEESETARIAESDLKRLLPHVDVSFIDASAQAQQLHGSLGQEQEMSRPLVWLVFGLIGLEFLVATRANSQRKTPGVLRSGLRRFLSLSWAGDVRER